MAEAAAKQNQRVVKVAPADLPLSCPLPTDEAWSLHPRVYIPVQKTGEASCPYCGTRYVLED